MGRRMLQTGVRKNVSERLRNSEFGADCPMDYRAWSPPRTKFCSHYHCLHAAGQRPVSRSRPLFIVGSYSQSALGTDTYIPDAGAGTLPDGYAHPVTLQYGYLRIEKCVLLPKNKLDMFLTVLPGAHLRPAGDPHPGTIPAPGTRVRGHLVLGTVGPHLAVPEYRPRIPREHPLSCSVWHPAVPVVFLVIVFIKFKGKKSNFGEFMTG
eukprot:Gb_13595 [translate_table: standard]